MVGNRSVHQPDIVARRGAITVNVGHGGLGWTYALATAEQAAMLVVQER